MIATMEPRGARQLRREQRMRVLLTGELRTSGATVPCRVHDISRAGACVETAQVARVGDQVVLVRTNIDAPGIVAWAARGRLGIRFDVPIRATDLLVQMSESRRARTATAAPFSGASALLPTR